MTKNLSILLVALALCAPALAEKPLPAKKGRAAAAATEPAPDAPPAPRVWTEEPTTFLGLELGAPIASQAAVKKCPTLSASYPGGLETLDWDEMKRSSPFCFANAPFYEFWNKPALGFAYELMFLKLNDDGLHGVMLTFPRSNLAQMMDLLLGKYGQPTTSTSSQQYQNGFGAAVNGAIHEWKGSKVTITFMEVGGKLSQSVLLVGTNEYFERTAKKAAENKGKFKDSL